MLDSKSKILNAATECFFQHGFNTASISMISRNSGISRVTIHKHFSSKDQLFCEVVARYVKLKHENLTRYMQSDKDFWLSTTELLLESCEQLFANISSNSVRVDLMHTAHKLCQDIIDKHRNDAREAIDKKLQKAINDKTISLTKIALTTNQFANNIESIFFSVMSANNCESLSDVIQKTVAIYQAATTPDN